MAIHDHLFHIENIREELLENKPFNYKKHYLNATGLWENDLEFILPKESKTLCKWAITLNNCLCSYRDRVHDKQSFIFGIFKNNHLQYAIELDHQDRIIQASGQHNSEVPEKVSQNIHAWHKAYFKNKKT